MGSKVRTTTVHHHHMRNDGCSTSLIILIPISEQPRKSYFELQEEAQQKYRNCRVPRRVIIPDPPPPVVEEVIFKKAKKSYCKTMNVMNIFSNLFEFCMLQFNRLSYTTLIIMRLLLFVFLLLMENRSVTCCRCPDWAGTIYQSKPKKQSKRSGSIVQCSGSCTGVSTTLTREAKVKLPRFVGVCVCLNVFVF